jgi:hypothetical protein
MAESIIPTKVPKTPQIPSVNNVSSLVPSPDILKNLSNSKTPTTFGGQLTDAAKQKLLSAATQSKLARLIQEKKDLVLEEIQIEIDHQQVLFKLEQDKTPKKQIVNGKETDIPPKITEEEYQLALIIENGGVLPNGEQIKGNYPEQKENLQTRKQENQKAIDDILKDPFRSQKEKFQQQLFKLKNRKKRTKEEKTKARKAALRTALKAGKRLLVPIITAFLVDKIAEVIAQNDKIGELVDKTNKIIEAANLSQNPVQLQNAKTVRDNALRIITNSENKIRRVIRDIERISQYVSIFSIIVTIISAIPIPTSVPPGIGIPVNIIMNFVKILNKANTIVLSLSAYLPTVLLCLNKAVQILNDYKSQLLNINEIINNAVFNNDTNTSPDVFLTPPTTNTTFEPYKGFAFAIKEEENNPKFVVRGFKRRYAIALNSQNTEVLRSEYSFTLDPNDLIEQLKLLIDDKNLVETSPRTSSTVPSQLNTDPTSKQLTPPPPKPDSTIQSAQKVVRKQPPAFKKLTGPNGAITTRIPLSLQEIALFKAQSSIPDFAGVPPIFNPLPGDSRFLLKEHKKWHREYKEYQKSVQNPVLKLPSE